MPLPTNAAQVASIEQLVHHIMDKLYKYIDFGPSAHPFCQSLAKELIATSAKHKPLPQASIEPINSIILNALDLIIYDPRFLNIELNHYFAAAAIEQFIQTLLASLWVKNDPQLYAAYATRQVVMLDTKIYQLLSIIALDDIPAELKCKLECLCLQGYRQFDQLSKPLCTLENLPHSYQQLIDTISLRRKKYANNQLFKLIEKRNTQTAMQQKLFMEGIIDSYLNPFDEYSSLVKIYTTLFNEALHYLQNESSEYDTSLCDVQFEHTSLVLRACQEFMLNMPQEKFRDANMFVRIIMQSLNDSTYHLNATYEEQLQILQAENGKVVYTLDLETPPPPFGEVFNEEVDEPLAPYTRPLVHHSIHKPIDDAKVILDALEELAEDEGISLYSYLKALSESDNLNTLEVKNTKILLLNQLNGLTNSQKISQLIKKLQEIINKNSEDIVQLADSAQRYLEHLHKVQIALNIAAEYDKKYILKRTLEAFEANLPRPNTPGQNRRNSSRSKPKPKPKPKSKPKPKPIEKIVDLRQNLSKLFDDIFKYLNQTHNSFISSTESRFIQRLEAIASRQFTSVENKTERNQQSKTEAYIMAWFFSNMLPSTRKLVLENTNDFYRKAISKHNSYLQYCFKIVTIANIDHAITENTRLHKSKIELENILANINHQDNSAKIIAYFIQNILKHLNKISKDREEQQYQKMKLLVNSNIILPALAQIQSKEKAAQEALERATSINPPSTEDLTPTSAATISASSTPAIVPQFSSSHSQMIHVGSSTISSVAPASEAERAKEKLEEEQRAIIPARKKHPNPNTHQIIFRKWEAEKIAAWNVLEEFRQAPQFVSFNKGSLLAYYNAYCDYCDLLIQFIREPGLYNHPSARDMKERITHELSALITWIAPQTGSIFIHVSQCPDRGSLLLRLNQTYFEATQQIIINGIAAADERLAPRPVRAQPHC